MVGLVSSAAGLVGFLSESDAELQVFALRAANEAIGLLWTELASAVGRIEALYEDEAFPERELAALVAAKIYYHLQEYDESMIFALGAGKLFDIEHPGEFEETIVARCIDTYIALSAAQRPAGNEAKTNDGLSDAFTGNSNGSASVAASQTSPTTPFSQSTLPSKSLLSREDSRQESSGNVDADGAAPSPPKLLVSTQKNLHLVIRRIFERCFQEGLYRQVVGISVEARNLDTLREAIIRATDGRSTQAVRGDELMEYLLDICMDVIQERSLRNDILRLILDLLLSNKISSPDYFSIAKCMVYLDQHTMAANLLKQLVEQETTKSRVVAYQISFDLYDNGSQDFLLKVVLELPQLEEERSEFANANGHASQPVEPESRETDPLLSPEQSASASNVSTVVSRTKPTVLTEEHKESYQAIRDILQGTKSIELGLEFLYRTNKTDRNTLSNLKNSLEARNSIFHSAVTFANAFMNSGTMDDWFIRENLDWLGKAVNWSKFSVTASLGVIHRGNLGQGQKLLEPYLRDSPTGQGSAYQKGGALFAIGLIYANHGKHVKDYLHNQLRNATSDEIVQHGASLGLGVASMASGSEEIVDELKQALYSDSAVSGQATGLAIGLVMLGTGSVKSIQDMHQYAHETEHEKTVRGLALGMALTMYSRQEAADMLIDGLLGDPDPTIRYGGIWTIALAYCGTSSNKAVRRLLHVAVSDVNDDVRRTAVLGLGFVLFRKPRSVPRMVELLAESYNPHVRYGATMALGIACAGTGLEEAVGLLEPMMKDSTDFVRQGAFIALAMIMVQQSEAMNPKTASVRKHFIKVIGDRHEDAMAKFGATIALGIIDAGGRNCTIGLQTQTGNLNMQAIVGMAIFTQYWYWFPLTHFMSLTFTPTTIIGVDQDLDLPQLTLYCNARPSIFDYPPTLEVKTEEAIEKVKTAVLSTTAQAKRRKLAKEKQQNPDSMDIDKTPSTPKPSEDDDKMDLEESKDGEKDDKDEVKDRESKARAKIEKEKVGFELDNMARVLPGQLRYISFPPGRYSPIKEVSRGVILLTDNEPSKEKSLVELKLKKPQAPAPTAGGASVEGTPEQPSIGHADAAAVLTAVDEDEEGVEEAQTPEAFDYVSDGEDDEN